MKSAIVLCLLLIGGFSTDLYPQNNGDHTGCDCKITFADNSENQEVHINQYTITGPEKPTVDRIALMVQKYPSDIKATEEYVKRFAASFCEIDGYPLTSVIVRRDMNTEDQYEILMIFDGFAKE